jgi:hypothetical protein
MRDKGYIGSSLLFTATFLADDIAYVIKMVAQIVSIVRRRTCIFFPLVDISVLFYHSTCMCTSHFTCHIVCKTQHE